LGQPITTVEKNAIDELTIKNKIAQPIQTIISNKNLLGNITPISTQRVNFNNFGSYSGTNSKIIKQNSISISKENLSLENKISFDYYDFFGNLKQYTPENGSPVAIIWGYDKTQPVAKIENLTYSSISPSLISAIETASGSTGTEGQLLIELNNLRNSLPDNAMATTYTYKPLIGVSTINDPKGHKITYTYDNANRLQYVKDKDGNILSENKYNYKP
jgi:YD repeat-containing protein